MIEEKGVAYQVMIKDRCPKHWKGKLNKPKENITFASYKKITQMKQFVKVLDKNG